jgi:hypothetical protein
MSRPFSSLLAAAICVALGAPAQAQSKPGAPSEDYALTIYSTADPAQFDPQEYVRQQQNRYNPVQNLPGYGVVRQTRPIDLTRGLNTIRFTDVASGIDPTTVSFLSLTDPNGTHVLEQNYEYDLVNSDKLLQKYVGKNITLARKTANGGSDVISGKLLSFDGGSFVIQNTEDQPTARPHTLPDGLNRKEVIQTNPIQIIPRSADITSIRLSELPGGLITQPTLVWSIDTDRAGKQQAQVTYQTDGLTWRADYNLIINKDDTKADLGAWVSILNESGASYPEAKLKLVAGVVHRVQPAQPMDYQMTRQIAVAKAESGFTEKSFFEYHMYTLGRATTLSNHSTKQIELFPAKTNVPVDKTFVYYGLPTGPQWFGASPRTDRNLATQTNKQLDIYLLMKNSEKNGLGIPLPAGRVRVYKRDEADKNLEFIGEDVIQHTPKDEQVMIKMGSAFDIVGERKQTNFTVNSNGHEMTESIEVVLRNHKDQAVRVIVKENLYRWNNWQITQASDKWEKQDSRTIHFPVDVPANGEKKVTYTVKYTW